MRRAFPTQPSSGISAAPCMQQQQLLNSEETSQKRIYGTFSSPLVFSNEHETSFVAQDGAAATYNHLNDELNIYSADKQSEVT